MAVKRPPHCAREQGVQSSSHLFTAQRRKPHQDFNSLFVGSLHQANSSSPELEKKRGSFLKLQTALANPKESLLLTEMEGLITQSKKLEVAFVPQIIIKLDLSHASRLEN